jgi:hypothetical protein
MRRWRAGCRGWVVVACTALAPAAALAQAAAPGGLRLGSWQGELQGIFEGQEQRTRIQGGPETDFSRRRALGRLTVRNEGFSVLDPRLLTGNLGLTYDVLRDRQESGGVATERTGKLTGYTFDATALAQMPYNATVFANRSQNFFTQPFGGSSDLTFESRGLVLRLREDSVLRERGLLPYFSASLRAYQEQNDELTSIAGQSFRRDDQRDVLTLEAHNGFETADLDFRYESTDFQNRVFAPGTYQSDVVNLNYSRDFGPTLNRRWDSRIFSSDRSGATRLRFASVDEQLRIAHHRDLSTTWRYVATRQEVARGTTITQNGVFRLRHQLYDNLTTDLEASDLQQTLPDGTRQTAYGQADFNYRRGLPDNARVHARLGGRYQRDDNALQASLIQVIDEPHAAPAVLGGGAGFLLNQRFVVASTIDVVDTRGGARLPTTLGIDYTVVAEGDLTRIVPLPTSAVIQPGDPLAVSYLYEVDASLRYATSSYWLGAGADFGWVAFSAGRDESRQAALSGRDSAFLEDRRKDEAQLEFRGQWGDVQARAGGDFVRYRATQLAYDSQRFNQLLRYRPHSGLSLALTTQQQRTDYDLPVRHSESRSARLTLDWFAPGGVLVTAYLAWSSYRDTQLPEDDVTEANLRLRRTWRKLELASTLGAIHRTRGTVDIDDKRIMLTATRKF